MPPLGQESTQFRVNTGRSLKDLFQYNISVIRKLTQAPDRWRSATNSRIWPIADFARRSLPPPGFADMTWYLRRTVMPSLSLRAMLRRRPAFSCQCLWSFTARAITRAPTNLAYVAMAFLCFAATVFPRVKRDRNSRWCFSVDHTTGRLDRQEFFSSASISPVSSADYDKTPRAAGQAQARVAYRATAAQRTVGRHACALSKNNPFAN
jgi:hypothetical protein